MRSPMKALQQTIDNSGVYGEGPNIPTLPRAARSVAATMQRECYWVKPKLEELTIIDGKAIRIVATRSEFPGVKMEVLITRTNNGGRKELGVYLLIGKEECSS